MAVEVMVSEKPVIEESEDVDDHKANMIDDEESKDENIEMTQGRDNSSFLEERSTMLVNETLSLKDKKRELNRQSLLAKRPNTPSSISAINDSTSEPKV